jgi:hypothetical protein
MHCSRDSIEEVGMMKGISKYKDHLGVQGIGESLGKREDNSETVSASQAASDV